MREILVYCNVFLLPLGCWCYEYICFMTFIDWYTLCIFECIHNILNYFLKCPLLVDNVHSHLSLMEWPQVSRVGPKQQSSQFTHGGSTPSISFLDEMRSLLAIPRESLYSTARENPCTEMKTWHSQKQ